MPRFDSPERPFEDVFDPKVTEFRRSMESQDVADPSRSTLTTVVRIRYILLLNLNSSLANFRLQLQRQPLSRF